MQRKECLEKGIIMILKNLKVVRDTMILDFRMTQNTWHMNYELWCPRNYKVTVQEDLFVWL